MTIVLWDTSALLKRYYAEVGSENADRIIDHPAVSLRVCTLLGYAETLAALHRKKNDKLISMEAYGQARGAFWDEWSNSTQAKLLDLNSAFYLNSIKMIERYNVNASDLVILEAYIEYSSTAQETCVLAASDRRMIGAASSEGLQIINPETVRGGEIDRLLNQ